VRYTTAGVLPGIFVYQRGIDVFSAGADSPFGLSLVDSRSLPYSIELPMQTQLSSGRTGVASERSVVGYGKPHLTEARRRSKPRLFAPGTQHFSGDLAVQQDRSVGSWIEFLL
jgi:hypothetical protein